MKNFISHVGSIREWSCPEGFEMRMMGLIGLLSILAICSSYDCEIAPEVPKFIIPQGMIYLDSEFAKKIGFVSSRFISCSYLWGEGNCIVINTIECTDRRHGYLRDLFRAIWDLGVEIAVRTPLGTMEQILMHYGFKKTLIPDLTYGRSELWVK
jgi:hypothetical protein